MTHQVGSIWCETKQYASNIRNRWFHILETSLDNASFSDLFKHLMFWLTMKAKLWPSWAHRCRNNFSLNPDLSKILNNSGLMNVRPNQETLFSRGNLQIKYFWNKWGYRISVLESNTCAHIYHKYMHTLNISNY